eukprot:COSAG05_NODE_73_length_21807_cov_283.593698_17_plen_84_part_00
MRLPIYRALAWDSCGLMLTQANMGGMDEMNGFYTKCLESLYPRGIINYSTCWCPLEICDSSRSHILRDNASGGHARRSWEPRG